MDCPECLRELRPDQARCRCGWGRPVAPGARHAVEAAHVTAHGAQTSRDLRQLLAKQNRPSKQWARDLLVRADISPVQRDLAQTALYGTTWACREPGQDDETLDD